ncbi:hypothetical protein PISL3812_07016 [Talaromyces islandicus]|uniref:Prolyl 4-hydroxylase alpha subunit domain-containing protein n=1 Tax=Talaromyces islandicus TaxID=28573 RepID=A0A0U1M4L9_TALIS|nr:hypothetical protein PISL3812_07016 [Talaromyces islandicus]
MALHVRPDFLPPQAPQNVTTSIIDFASTNPPIPRYKRNFAAVIDNFMTEDECNELLALAEQSSLSADSESPNWERAMINIGGGRQALATDVRNCGRIILDSPDIAGRLLARLNPFFRRWEMDRLEDRLPVTGLAGRETIYYLTRLNERLRFLKYVGGEYFRPHWDANYNTPDGNEISLFTIHLYLNGEGEEGQDLQEVLKQQSMEVEGEEFLQVDTQGELLGGATSFIPSWIEEDKAVRVWPKTGRVLVFQQNDLLHGGDSVYRGTKYTVRTDVMYSKKNPATVSTR